MAHSLPKTHQFNFRLSPKDYELAHRTARYYGVSVAELMRILLVRESGLVPKHFPAPATLVEVFEKEASEMLRQDPIVKVKGRRTLDAGRSRLSRGRVR